MVGKIKFFDSKKGYGFILSADVEGDIFVHYRDVLQDGPREFQPGERVDFDLETNARTGKPRAVRVSRV